MLNLSPVRVQLSPAQSSPVQSTPAQYRNTVPPQRFGAAFYAPFFNMFTGKYTPQQHEEARIAQRQLIDAELTTKEVDGKWVTHKTENPVNGSTNRQPGT